MGHYESNTVLPVGNYQEQVVDNSSSIVAFLNRQSTLAIKKQRQILINKHPKVIFTYRKTNQDYVMPNYIKIFEFKSNNILTIHVFLVKLGKDNF